MTLCVVQVLLSPAKYCAGVVFAVPAGDRDDVRGGELINSSSRVYLKMQGD